MILPQPYDNIALPNYICLAATLVLLYHWPAAAGKRPGKALRNCFPYAINDAMPALETVTGNLNNRAPASYHYPLYQEHSP
jgi:hypothetical protein